MLSKRQFVLNKETFSEVTEQIHAELSKTKANKKEVLRADLLLEETFMRMTEIGKAAEVKVSIRQRLGDLSLIGGIIHLLRSLIMTRMTRTITARLF